jgi:hypothetical protein
MYCGKKIVSQQYRYNVLQQSIQVWTYANNRQRLNHNSCQFVSYTCLPEFYCFLFLFKISHFFKVIYVRLI